MAPRANVPRVSRKGFRAWLLTQPPGRKFWPICSQNCPLSRYVASQGFKEVRAGADAVFYANGAGGARMQMPEWVDTFHHQMFSHPAYSTDAQCARPRTGLWAEDGTMYLTSTQLLDCLKRS